MVTASSYSSRLTYRVGLSSNRQHYHIDVCLEDNREDY